MEKACWNESIFCVDIGVGQHETSCKQSVDAVAREIVESQQIKSPRLKQRKRKACFSPQTAEGRKRADFPTNSYTLHKRTNRANHGQQTPTPFIITPLSSFLGRNRINFLHWESRSSTWKTPFKPIQHPLLSSSSFIQWLDISWILVLFYLVKSDITSIITEK